MEISIATADELFRKVRIENTLTTIDGRTVALKDGAHRTRRQFHDGTVAPRHVEVTFEAELQETTGERAGRQ